MDYESTEREPTTLNNIANTLIRFCKQSFIDPITLLVLARQLPPICRQLNLVLVP